MLNKAANPAGKGTIVLDSSNPTKPFSVVKLYKSSGGKKILLLFIILEEITYISLSGKHAIF